MADQAFTDVQPTSATAEKPSIGPTKQPDWTTRIEQADPEAHPVFGPVLKALQEGLQYYHQLPGTNAAETGVSAKDYVEAQEAHGEDRAGWMQGLTDESKWYNQPFARFREGLDRMTADLHDYAETHKGSLTPAAYLMLHGVAAAGEAAPVGRNAVGTAMALAVPPEVGSEGRAFLDVADVHRAAEAAGVEYRGLQQGIPGKLDDVLIFQDPKSGTSVGVPRAEFSPEKLTEHVENARARMAPKLPTNDELFNAINQKMPHDRVRAGQLADMHLDRLTHPEKYNPAEVEQSKSAVNMWLGPERRATPRPSEDLATRAKRLYGATLDHEALANGERAMGFYLPDGSFVGRPTAKASEDFTHHRIAAEIMGEPNAEALPVSAQASKMRQFMDEAGAVRMHNAEGEANVQTGSQRPTPEQVQAIAKLAKASNGRVVWDLGHDKPTYGEGTVGDFQRALDQRYGPETKATTLPYKLPGAPLHGFYSPLNRAAEARLQDGMTGEQALATLRNTPGVKPAELKFTGLEDLLQARGQAKVTKQEVLDHLADNEVQVKEQQLVSPPLDKWTVKRYKPYFADANDLKVQDVEVYDENGKLVKESRAVPIERGTEYIKQDAANKAIYKPQYEQYALPGPKENYRELLFNKPGAKEFKAAHFGQYGQNLLAHARVTDRMINGKKTLFVEELQSDWARALREEGTRRTQPRNLEVQPIQEAEKTVGRTLVGDDSRWKYAIVDKDQNSIHTGQAYFETKEAAEAHANVLRGQQSQTGVAPQPFRDWHELVLKRLLRMAGEEGYDQLAWTTGRQQAERYNLGNVADRLLWDENSHKLNVVRNGQVVHSQVVEPKELPEYIGKEAAAKLQETDPVHITPGHPDYNKAAFTGDYHILDTKDLQVGGRWASHLYDEMAPAFVDKFGKQWGLKTETGQVAADKVPSSLKGGKSTMEDVHVVPLTDQFKQALPQTKFPLFRTGGAPTHVLTHEWGHATVAAAHGFHVEDMVGPGHPALPQLAQAGARIDIPELTVTDQGATLTDTARLPQILEVAAGGAAAEELAGGPRWDENQGFTGDGELMYELLRNTGFDADEATHLMDQYVQKAKGTLSHAKLRGLTPPEETGELMPGQLVSSQTMQAHVNEVRRRLYGEGHDAGGAEGGGASGAEAEPDGEGTTTGAATGAATLASTKPIKWGGVKIDNKLLGTKDYPNFSRGFDSWLNDNWGYVDDEEYRPAVKAIRSYLESHRDELRQVETEIKPWLAKRDQAFDKLIADPDSTESFPELHSSSLPPKVAVFFAKLAEIGEKAPREEGKLKLRQNVADNETMQDPDTRFNAARHEAGHAVISELTRPGSVNAMSLDERGGLTEIKNPPGVTSPSGLSPDQVKDLVAMSYAGGLQEPGGTTVKHVSGDTQVREKLLGPQGLAANEDMAAARARVNALLADPANLRKIDLLAKALNEKGKLTGDEVRKLVGGK